MIRYTLSIMFLIMTSGCSGSTAASDAVTSTLTDEDSAMVENVEAVETDLRRDKQQGHPANTEMKVVAEDFFAIAEVNDSLYATMYGVSFHEGAPVRRADLRDVRVLHHDFDGNIHTGRIICHKSLATDVLEIFKELYDIAYPIESVMPIDNFGGDDGESMKANNTSCFNFRKTPGGSRLSNHAYGTAIDINPLFNPYVRRTKRGTVVLPPDGAQYCDRTLGYPGMLTPSDPCVRIFKKHGFRWGGEWRGMTRDYQHFEKPLRKK